jgi:hypothetical protein
MRAYFEVEDFTRIPAEICHRSYYSYELDSGEMAMALRIGIKTRLA